MSEQVFMIDIETTGVDKDAQILQISILQNEFDSRKYLKPKKSYNRYIHVDHGPLTEFAKKNQGALYEKCQAAPKMSPEAVRQEILMFFEDCHAELPVTVMGKNASHFDMPRLAAAGYLKESQWVEGEDGKQKLVGDYSYRIEELTGYIAGFSRATGLPRNALIEAAMAIYPEIKLPEDLELHDGLYDCYMQTRLYNGLIRLQRMPGKVV